MGKASELVRALLAEITLMESHIDTQAFEIRDANERMDAMKIVGLDIPHYTMNLRVGYLCERHGYLVGAYQELQKQHDELSKFKYGADSLDSNEEKDIE